MGLTAALSAMGKAVAGAASAAATTEGLLIAGIGLSAFGQIRAGQAAEAQAEGEEALAEHKRTVAEQHAEAAKRKTTFDQVRAAKRGQRILGTLRAGLGGSGAVIEEGAPLELVSEQADELALENALIGIEGRTRAGQFASQADIFGLEADVAGMRAKAAMPTAFLRAGGTLLTGLGTVKALGVGGKTTTTGTGTAARTSSPGTLRFGSRTVSPRTGLVPQF